jgi:hypothetical protein
MSAGEGEAGVRFDGSEQPDVTRSRPPCMVRSFAQQRRLIEAVGPRESHCPLSQSAPFVDPL